MKRIGITLLNVFAVYLQALSFFFYGPNFLKVSQYWSEYATSSPMSLLFPAIVFLFFAAAAVFVVASVFISQKRYSSDWALWGAFISFASSFVLPFWIMLLMS